ncbi:MAG TPA: hypothetical protein VGA38_05630 [Candidatus Limnocylindria bacterium]
MRGITGGRGVLGGAVLLAVGFAVLLPPMGVRDAGAYLFLFLGVAFLIAYVAGTQQFVYLVPAATMIGFGLGLIIPTAFSLQAEASAIFLASLAAAFVVIYLLSPSRKIPLIVAAVIGVVALADLFAKIELIPAGFQPYFVPVILIVTGAYLILEPRTH